MALPCGPAWVEGTCSAGGGASERGLSPDARSAQDRTGPPFSERRPPWTVTVRLVSVLVEENTVPPVLPVAFSLRLGLRVQV